MRFSVWLVVVMCSLGCSSTPEGSGEETQASALLRKVVRIGVVPFERVLVARDRPEVSEREAILRELFLESGCEPFDPIRSDELRTPPVVCRIPGAGPETILVTSEFGRARKSQRDGWEAASLLPLIAQSVSAVPRAHTVLFVAFEDAPSGYRTEGAIPRALAMFPVGERPELEAWVSLTASDRTVRAVWKPGSSETLLQDFLSVAHYTGAPVALIRRGQVQDEATSPPRLSAVVGHSFDDDYLASYRAFAAYIAFVDYALDARAEAEAGEAEPVPL